MDKTSCTVCSSRNDLPFFEQNRNQLNGLKISKQQINVALRYPDQETTYTNKLYGGKTSTQYINLVSQYSAKGTTHLIF